MSTTETKVRHSATPWTTGENGDGCAKGHAIVADGIVIAKVYGRGYPSGAGWHPQSEADAEFIVRAVNSHADMLEALEHAAEIIKVARNYFPKSISNRDRFDLENTNAAINKAIYRAKGGAA